MRETENIYKISGGKSGGKMHFRKVDIGGRII
jgi:hypothetical protein